MQTLKQVDQQLARVGHFNRYWARAEAHELPHILTNDEKILAAVTGRYQNGFSLLIATNWRLLLIDKKPLFLNMEDTRYDMISEVDYSNYFLDAVVNIRTINKVLTFKSIRQRKLRRMATLIQQKVMELRQQSQQDFQNQFQQQAPLQPQIMPAAPAQPMAAQPQQFVAMAPSPSPQQLEQSATDLGAMVLNQPQTTGIRRFNPIPGQPLTIRKRVSRFYPTAQTRL